MHIRSILAITAIAFGLNTGMANAEPRDTRDDKGQGQRQEQPRHDKTQSHDAAPRHEANKHSGNHSAPQQHAQGKPHAASKPAPAADRGRGAGPDRRYFKGDRLPANHRGHQDVIDNWRDYHLSAPPRGQHWVQLGADYVLVAITTGTITQIFFGN